MRRDALLLHAYAFIYCLRSFFAFLQYFFFCVGKNQTESSVHIKNETYDFNKVTSDVMI